MAYCKQPLCFQLPTVSFTKLFDRDHPFFTKQLYETIDKRGGLKCFPCIVSDAGVGVEETAGYIINQCPTALKDLFINAKNIMIKGATPIRPSHYFLN